MISASQTSRLFLPIDRLIAALTDPDRRERTAVYVLAAYTASWTLVGMLAKANQGIHYDMAGVVAWSREPALGYPQHPPLAPWLVRAWFSVFPLADWAYYLLAMTTAAIALWFAWRVCARFLDAEKRVIALALLTLVPFYNFHALKFDHNTVLLPLWAATTLWFIRSFETRSVGWAALAGAGAAAAMLAKYWSIYLLAGLALAALLDTRRSIYFRSFAPWITVVVGAILLTPHLAWLIANDFSPMAYAVSIHHLASFGATLVSVAGYVAGTAGYIALPVVLVLAASQSNRAALRDMLVPQEPARHFAAIAFWTPLLLPALVVLASHLELNSIWSISGLTLLPVVLLSSPLITISQASILRIVTLAVLLPPAMVLAAPGFAVVAHRAGSVNPASAHGRLLAQRLEQEWRHTTDAPLHLVGGDLDLANIVAFYLPERPSTFPFSEPQLAPWANDERISRQGIAIVCYATGPDCLHQLVNAPAHRIAANGPPGRRMVVKIARSFFGIPGKPTRYLIITVPPQP